MQLLSLSFTAFINKRQLYSARKKRITMFIWATIAGKAFSQQPSTSNWITVQLPVVYNTHWQSLHEFSYRTLGEAVTLNQLFIRTGIRHTFNQKWSTSLICDLIHSRVKPYDKNDL